MAPLPSSTHAIIQTEFGAADVMRLGDAPLPPLGEHDVLVANFATGVNPIDFKVRAGLEPGKTIDPAAPVVLGWDGAGVVEAKGSQVRGLAIGDEVYYAGDLFKMGSYAEKTVVDSRMVARKPQSLTFEEASSIPLVAETAHEALVETMQVEAGKTILIYNGAGGVGSFAIQYAKALGLTVITTAGNPDSNKWVTGLGADFVLDYHAPLEPQLSKLGAPKPDYAFDLRDNVKIAEIVKLLKPFGKVALTWPLSDDAGIDWMDCFFNRKSIMYELMFTRAMHGIQLEKQARALADIAKLIDQGKIKHTLTKVLPWDKVQEAHGLQESGTVVGKIVMSIDATRSKMKTQRTRSMCWSCLGMS